jgi:hypothetical protein
VTLYRCFAWDARAKTDAPDGPLWYPRIYQGDGRHDNPDVYGCLYLSASALSPVVEQLARFRGQALRPSFLRRRGIGLALAEITLLDTAALIDLDDPRQLVRERLRPSVVATRVRTTTQQQARALYERYPYAAGLRWWSTFESTWINVTIFDRAASRLRLVDVRALSLDDPAIVDAADWLGLPSA